MQCAKRITNRFACTSSAIDKYMSPCSLSNYICRYTPVINKLTTYSSLLYDRCNLIVINMISKTVGKASGQWRKDVYSKMSRYDNYRARSAYKLIQLDDKFKFLKPGKVVLEVGAAPGSWTQVICERLKLSDKDVKSGERGMCIAVDRSAIAPVDGAICLGNADITSPFTQSKLLTWLDGRLVDCLLSDMAPNCTGQKYHNHDLIMSLIRSILPFGLEVLRPKSGLFLTKIFDGDQTENLVKYLDLHFERTRRVKPPASRGDSSESYILAQGYRGNEKRES